MVPCGILAAPPNTTMTRPPSSAPRTRFARRLDALAAVFEWLDRWFEGAGMAESDRFALRLAAEELFANAVRHNASGEGQVEMEGRVEDGRAILVLVDHDADRFDPRTLPEPLVHAPIEERRPGGLGIHLIRQLTDRIDYDHDGRRATTTIVRTLG